MKWWNGWFWHLSHTCRTMRAQLHLLLSSLLCPRGKYRHFQKIEQSIQLLVQPAQHYRYTDLYRNTVIYNINITGNRIFKNNHKLLNILLHCFLVAILLIQWKDSFLKGMHYCSESSQASYYNADYTLSYCIQSKKLKFSKNEFFISTTSFFIVVLIHFLLTSIWWKN